MTENSAPASISPRLRARLRPASVGFLLAAIALCTMALLSWQATRDSREQVRWITHTYEVREAIDTALSQFLDYESGAHIFALTGDEAFLEGAHRTARSGFDETLVRLRALTADNPSQGQRLDRLDRQMTAAENASQQVVASRRQTGAAPNAAVLKDARAMVVAVRATLEEMKEEEARLIGDRAQKIAAARQRSDVLALFGTILGVGGLLGAVLLSKRRADASDHAQEEIRGLNAQLEQRVAARTAALHEEIDARERAQGALRVSEQRLAGIIDSAMDAIITVDASHRVILFNHAAEQMFRCPANEALGQSIERFIPARFRAGHAAHIRRFGEAGVTKRAMGALGAISGLRTDGEEFPIEASISQIEAGGEKLFTVILRDITERQQNEAALREAKSDLEAKVAARTAELLDAKERAESADRIKSAFVASMSHELRTPLNAVIGFTGTLLMKLPGPLNAAQEKQLRTVQSSARHLLSLINDILDLGRIEAGKMVPHLEVVEVSALVLEAAAAVRPAAEARNLDFRVSVPAGPTPFRTDRRALHQILLNLTSNAIKFTDMGAVSLTLRLNERGLECAVRDTGVGIRAEDRPRLFRAFEQLEANGRPRHGTGLGLHLSQKMAAMLGGRIDCESEPGRGSCFTLHLPTDPPCPPAS